MIRVLMADDHTIVRKGLVQVLTDFADTFVVDEAEDGEEALQKALNNDYDMVVLDISMPGKGGLETLKELKGCKPKLPVLILSMHDEEQYALRALRAGASGYLTKGSAADELVTAIRKVLRGGKYISNALAENIAFGLVGIGDEPLHKTLSDREFQVMCLIASGKPVSVIAGELSLSVKTISTLRTRLLKKMKMKNNAEVTHYAIMNKLAM